MRYARAWAGIADVHIVQAPNFFEPPGPNYAQGKAAALRALALDSTIADAHASLGTVHFLFDRDWAAADAAYQRALALDPGYSSGRYFYALFLSGRGRVTEAIAEAKRAMALDPLAPPEEKLPEAPGPPDAPPDEFRLGSSNPLSRPDPPHAMNANRDDATATLKAGFTDQVMA